MFLLGAGSSSSSWRLWSVGLLVLLLLAVEAVLGAMDVNSRCKCACTFKNANASRHVVVVNSDVQPENCRCSIIVADPPAECEYHCECVYQNRNTTTIQVVVIGMITLVSGLFVYMLFLLCLDPLINRRSRAGRWRLQELDDAVNLEHFSVATPTSSFTEPHQQPLSMGDEAGAPSAGTTPTGRLRLDQSMGRGTPGSAAGAEDVDENRSRSQSVLNRLRMPHERWQGQLQNQRHNVYSNRSVLN